MTDLRTAAQQALAFTMRDFASLRDFEAAKAVLHDNLRTALAQQKDPTDPGNDVDVLREHVRHLERRVRQLQAHQAEPTRSQQMVAAGFKPRDRRLECDECGGKFTAQMLPIHKCAQQAEAVEPVAWLQPKTVDGYSRPDLGYETCSKADYGAFPVCHAPPRRTMVPLTEEEIKTAFHAARNAKLGASQDNSRHRLSVIEIARAVEQASWEKNHGQA